jgi:hypothetical protein
MHKITFDRETFEEYKKLYLKAVSEGQDTFVHKGNLVFVHNAIRLINKFEPHFKDMSINHAEISYIF